MLIRNNRGKLTTFAYGVSQCCAKKRNVFFFCHFPKEYVGRSIQNAVNTKLYISSKILRAVYLYSFSDFPALILISTRSTSVLGSHHMNEMAFSNNSWLSCFSSEYIRNSTLKTQNLFLELRRRRRRRRRGRRTK